MEPRVRDHLRQIILQHGRALCDDPPRCEAMLRDLCAQHNPEIVLLVRALQHRVPAALLANAAGLPPPLLVDQLGRGMEGELFLTAEAAHWAVETWAIGLGVIAGPIPLATAAQDPSAPPDIHGWPTSRVQALQRDAAWAAGQPLVFRDPLGAPVTLPQSTDVVAWLNRKVVTVVAEGPDLVIIPAGRFLMGSPVQEERRSDDEGPQHQVILFRPFAVGRHAATFDDYDAFCAATDRAKPPDQGWGRGRRPVINVTWGDAVAYCQWLSAQTGQIYRLPSEAEWEYACRAGTATPFHFGTTISTDQANYDGRCNYNFGVGKYRQQTVSVGSLPANPWGLHEVHGNVWEWCEDCWNDNYQGAPTDGSAWLKGDCSRRVLRGGSWCFSPWNLRSAIRKWQSPGYPFNKLERGFRVARMLTH